MVIGGNSLLMASERPMRAPATSLGDGVTHRQVRDHLPGDAQGIEDRNGSAREDTQRTGEAGRVESAYQFADQRDAQLQHMKSALRPRLGEPARQHDNAYDGDDQNVDAGAVAGSH